MTPIRLIYLTDNANLRTLCDLYWELNVEGKFSYTTTAIAAKFSIAAQGINKIVNEYSSAYSSETLCTQCGSPYIFSSRNDFQQHRDYAKSWVCDTCKAKIKEQEKLNQAVQQEQQRKIIRATFDPLTRETVNLDEISLENAVSLLSLIRLNGNETLDRIMPLWTAKEPLAPSETFSINILSELYQADLIFVHPDSSVDAFSFTDNSIENFDLRKVTWTFPILEDLDNPKEILAFLEETFRDMAWQETWYDEQLNLWKKIALEESLQYLQVCLEEHSFTLNPGDKTLLVFKNLLEEFSVGQIYNLIWRAAKDAAAFYMREKVTKPHAANTVVGSVQRQAERAKSEGWTVKAYGRDRRCPQSMISQVFFNSVLQIGSNGFNQPPH